MLSPRTGGKGKSSEPVYVNVPPPANNNAQQAEKKLTKLFAKRVSSPAGSVTTVNSVFRGVAHVRPQDVQEWAVACPSTVILVNGEKPDAIATDHDPRTAYGESRNSRPSTGYTTPQSPSQPFPGLSVAPTMPEAISEETRTRSHDYLNLPVTRVNIQDETSDSAPEMPQQNHLGLLQELCFSVTGALHMASGSDSGLTEDSDTDRMSRGGPRRLQYASARPDWCEVNTSCPISISFPEVNRVTMNCTDCIVQYRKLTGCKWQLEFSMPGKKGNNRYEVETITPRFQAPGDRMILILSTDESHVLAVAKLKVVASPPNTQFKVFVIPSSSGGSTTDTVKQMVQVLSSPAGSGSHLLTCGNLYCLGGQEQEATDLAHGLLDFALDGIGGGLPPSLSLRCLLQSLSNLHHVLETYHLANGSLQNLCEMVRQKCTQQSVVEDVEFLANYCIQGVAGDPNLSDMSESADEHLDDGNFGYPFNRHARSVSPIYDEVSGYGKDNTILSHEYATPGNHIQPQESGLQWPSKLDHLSEETRIQILTQVKDGTITTFKAMEKAREYAYAPRSASAPNSPALSKKRKNANKKKGGSHSGGGLFDLFKKKPQTTAKTRCAKDSQSDISSEIDIHQSRHRKGKKTRPEEETQKIRRKLSTSSADTVASSTSSVGTVGTVGTISVTSDEKQVEDTSKLADGNSDKARHRISSDSGVADMMASIHPLSPVHPSSPNSDKKFGDCLVEMREKMHKRISPLSGNPPPQ